MRGRRGRLPARRARDRRPRQQPGARRLREGGARPTARATAASASSTRRSCARRTSPATSALGVIASIQPSHCIDDMRWAERRIGAARGARRLQLRARSSTAGVPVAFGTDWFVEPLDPRLGLYAAVTRELPEGGPAGRLVPGGEDHPRGRARPLHARLGVRRVRRRRDKGTLGPGMLADLVVFARRPVRACRRASSSTTPVDLTIVGGRVVFERDDEARRARRAAATSRSAWATASATARCSTARSPIRATPTSARTRASGHNEALEFLGDAVLGFVVAELLHRARPRRQRGRQEPGAGRALVRRHAASRSARRLWACRPSCAWAAARRRPAAGASRHLWADAYEAVIAALYLDGGHRRRACFVQRRVRAAQLADSALELARDFKSALQELLQGRGQPVPEYGCSPRKARRTRGTFGVGCVIDGKTAAKGEGRSKKQAQQDRRARKRSRPHADSRYSMTPPPRQTSSS